MSTSNEAAPVYAEDGPAENAFRWVVTLVLCIVVAVGTPLLMIGIFLQQTIDDSDGFVEATGVIIEEPGVQDAIATEVSNQLAAEIDDRLGYAAVRPEDLRGVVLPMVQSPQFRTLWDELMVEAHRSLHPVVYGGRTDTVAAEDGTVTVDLAGVARMAQERLSTTRFGPLLGVVDLSRVRWDFTVFSSPDLVRVQGVARAVDTAVPIARWVLPGLVVVAFLVAPRRWRVVRWLGIGGVIGALVVGVGLALARVRYVAAVGDLGVDEPAAITTYDALIGRLAAWNRIYFVAALLVFAASLLLSPWRKRWHDRAERTSAPGVRSPVRWVAGHRGDLVLAAVAVGLAVLVWWPEPTRTVLIAVGGAVVLVLLIALIVGRGGADRRADADRSASA